MFTGIVAELGRVSDLRSAGDDVRLQVVGSLLTDARPGDSVAVNGVCLTVVEVEGRTAALDVVPETLRRTALGHLAAGDPVNLELAVTPTTRLGGHLVQGHVDGVGSVLARSPGTGYDDVTVRVPSALERYVVEKGSIALDGVSLTVAALHDGALTVSLIPETLQRTTWGSREVGDPVNVEVDVLAKYVERLLAANAAASAQEERS
jgi:riboflavin synthase